MLKNFLQCTRHPQQQEIIMSKMSIVPQIRNSALEENTQGKGKMFQKAID